MTCYDVFNGDADGICALQQLRLQFPREAVQISGLKRDIGLLQRVNAAPGDEITVLDISLDNNRDALIAALQIGARVFYADHHYPGNIPINELLECHIDVTANTCTSLIINRLLDQARGCWAVVGAFGDNFDLEAKRLGHDLGVSAHDLAEFQQLGICLNYNGYGFELEDLLFHPVDLFNLISPYQNPLEFIASEDGYTKLQMQFENDMSSALRIRPDYELDTAAVFLLPNESWARRVVGAVGNDLAKHHRHRAHALLVDMGDGNYRVSVRAPYNDMQGADILCRQFNSGGGRKAAAGINLLPSHALGQFVDRFNRQFGGQV